MTAALFGVGGAALGLGVGFAMGSFAEYWRQRRWTQTARCTVWRCNAMEASPHQVRPEVWVRLCDEHVGALRRTWRP